MIKNLIIGLVLLFSVSTKAQHCPFDFSAIIVLHIHAENDSLVIPNLNVTMYHPGKKDNSKSWNKKDYDLWQNPSETTFRGYIDNEHPAVPEKIRFPFAKDNYVAVVSRSFLAKEYVIKIEDPSGKYKPQKIKPNNKDVYSLCGTYQQKTYNSRGDNAVIYQPIDVVLK